MPNKLQRIRIGSGALDAAGDAEAYSVPVRGKVLAVQIKYPSNTCEVDLTSSDEQVEQTVLDLAASNTDVVVYPRVKVQNNAGTDVTYDGTNEVHEEYVVFGRLKLVIASGTEGDEVTVDVLVEEY